MEQKDSESIAQFILMLISAIIGYIVSTNLQTSAPFKISIILILVFISFILYTSLIGRPWPRSYYRYLVCNGTESDIDSFFWAFHDYFEILLKLNHSKILDLSKTDDFAYLSLENNNLKIEAENTKALDAICDFVKEILESNDIENIEIRELNFQNKLIARIMMNINFRASTTHMIMLNRIKLKKSDFKGIYSTSEILNLDREGENTFTSFSWPDEKDFLLLNEKSSFSGISEVFEPNGTYNYPIIRSRNILLDEYNSNLIYSVTIDAKWRIPYLKSLSLFADAINDFDEYLNIWDDIDSKTGVKYRFKDFESIGIRIQDGINSKKYAKKITFISENNRKFTKDENM